MPLSKCDVRVHTCSDDIQRRQRRQTISETHNNSDSEQHCRSHNVGDLFYYYFLPSPRKFNVYDAVIAFNLFSNFFRTYGMCLHERLHYNKIAFGRRASSSHPFAVRFLVSVFKSIFVLAIRFADLNKKDLLQPVRVIFITAKAKHRVLFGVRCVHARCRRIDGNPITRGE